MAFPTLRLTKIIWAIDLIREMDLPEFYPENLTKNMKWHHIANIKELGDNQLQHYRVDNRTIFVYHSDKYTRVYDARCPHQQTELTLEHLEGDCLMSPKHQWKFNVKTGDCIEKGKLPLLELKSMINDNLLSAYW